MGVSCELGPGVHRPLLRQRSSRRPENLCPPWQRAVSAVWTAQPPRPPVHRSPRPRKTRWVLGCKISEGKPEIGDRFQSETKAGRRSTRDRTQIKGHIFCPSALGPSCEVTKCTARAEILQNSNHSRICQLFKTRYPCCPSSLHVRS